MNIPHGTLTFKIEGHVVHSHADHSFNLEGMTLFFDQLFEVAATLDYWVLNIHLTEDVGITPDALTYATEKILLLPDTGCLGVGSLIPSNILQHLTKLVYEDNDIPQLSSSDPEEIEVFLEELLAKHLRSI